MEVAGIKSIGTLIASFGAYILGMINEWVVVLVFFMLLDMGTGLLRSWMTKSWNSTIGMSGIIKKVAIIFLIGMAGGVEYIISAAGQDSKGIVILGVTSFFIVNEGISILENCAQLGLPIPPILYNALEKLNKEPIGKEHFLDRNPHLQELDKVELIKEVEVLQNEIKFEKKENLHS
ncbi:phage holin family protein [Peribacillus psychrosaccharolyticus]|uniref:phage holin family protein n=1 Tax=Peribacillus psychrosaccharolyticus TaxID=1407 RepID=UPI003D2E616A